MTRGPRYQSGNPSDNQPKDHPNNKEPKDRKQGIQGARLVSAQQRLRLRLPIGGIAVEHADDAIDATVDTAGKIARLELRNDRG
jgi:hypothetical protein